MSGEYRSYNCFFHHLFVVVFARLRSPHQVDCQGFSGVSFLHVGASASFYTTLAF
jgi:hypothetical protein